MWPELRAELLRGQWPSKGEEGNASPLTTPGNCGSRGLSLQRLRFKSEPPPRACRGTATRPHGLRVGSRAAPWDQLCGLSVHPRPRPQEAWGRLESQAVPAPWPSILLQRLLGICQERGTKAPAPTLLCHRRHRHLVRCHGDAHGHQGTGPTSICLNSTNRSRCGNLRQASEAVEGSCPRCSGGWVRAAAACPHDLPPKWPAPVQQHNGHV